MSNIQQLNETIDFTHKGIIITMRLDYEVGTVSFVNPNGSDKNWKFIDRTKEYLGGWYLIFEAMQEAVKYADERLS